MDEPKCIKDIVTNLDYPNCLIFVNGHQKDENYIIRDGEICTIRQYAGGFWDGVVNVFEKVADFVMDVQDTIEGGFEYLGGVLSGDEAMKDNAKNKIITAWTTNRFDDEPDAPTTITATAKTPTSTGQLVDIPTIAGAKNTSANGSPFPYVMGKHRYSPRYISSYRLLSGVDGENQTYHGLYLLGLGDIDAKDFKLGQIDLNPNSDNVVNSVIASGYNTAFFPNARLEIAQSGHDLSLYPDMIFEEQRSTELTNIDGNNGLTAYAFSAPYPRELELEFTFKGLGYYDADSKFNPLSVDIRVEYSTDGGNTFKPFAPIGATQTGRTITIENMGGGIQRVTGKKAKTMRFVAHLNLSHDEALSVTNDVVEFRVKRVSAKKETSQTVKQVFDDVYLTGIRTWCYDPTADNSVELKPQKPFNASSRDKTTRLAFEVVASDAMSDTLDELNCMVSGKYRTVEKRADGSYGGWTDSKTYTDNPASIVLDILTNKYLRGEYAYSDSELDIESFREFYIWCDTVNETKPKYRCNGIMTTQTRTDEMVNRICSIGRAFKTLNGRKWGICIDNERDTPVMVINNQSILSASNQISFDELPDAYRVSFVNELLGYKTDERDIFFDYATEAEWKRANPNKEPTVSQISVMYITNPEDVYRYVKGVIARKVCRNEIWQRTLGIDGNLLEVGNLATLQDDTIMVGIGDGAEITAIDYDYGYIKGFATDGMFPVDDLTKRYGVKIEQADGVNEPRIQTYEVKTDHTGVYSYFEFVSPISVDAELLPSVGDILSFGEYDSITTDVLVFAKRANGDGTFDFTLVPYNAGVYAEPSTVPPHVSYITQPTDFSNVPVPQRYATVEDLVNGLSEVSNKQADYWTAIARDGVVTPDEKVTLDKEWQTVTGEKTLITEKIDKLGAKTREEYTNYISAYNNLYTYLNDTISVFDDMSTSTIINSDEFIDMYNKFYIALDIVKTYIDYNDIKETLTNRVPIMNISAPYIKCTKMDEGGSYLEFDPPELTVSATLFDGEKSFPYKGVFEIYINNETVPFYDSKKTESEITIEVPPYTTQMHFILRDSMGLVIFDNEYRDVISKKDKFNLAITNKYQLIKNSTDDIQMYIPSVVVGTMGTNEKPTDIIATCNDDIDIVLDGNVINFSNKSQFQKETVINVDAFVDGDILDVFGFVSGDDVIILGIEDSVLGDTDAGLIQSSITIRDYDTETFRVNMEKADGKYLGNIYNITTNQEQRERTGYYYGLPDNPNTGDYFSYAGDNIDKFKNGLTYIYNGVDWGVDDKAEHNVTSLPNMLNTLDDDADSPSYTDNGAYNRLFVKALLADKAFIRDLLTETLIISKNGSISSSDYVPNLSGFCLQNITDDETGEIHSQFECTDGLFRGNIESGSLVSVRGSDRSRVFDFDNFGEIICRTLSQKGVTQGENSGIVLYNGVQYNHFNYSFNWDDSYSTYKLQMVYRCELDANYYPIAPDWMDITTKLPSQTTRYGYNYVLIWREYTIRAITETCYFGATGTNGIPETIVSGVNTRYEVGGYKEWVESQERNLSRSALSDYVPPYLGRVGVQQGWDKEKQHLGIWLAPEIYIAISLIVSHLPRVQFSLDMTASTGYVRLLNPTSYDENLLSGTLYVENGYVKIKQ